MIFLALLKSWQETKARAEAEARASEAENARKAAEAERDREIKVDKATSEKPVLSTRACRPKVGKQNR